MKSRNELIQDLKTCKELLNKIDELGDSISLLEEQIFGDGICKATEGLESVREELYKIEEIAAQNLGEFVFEKETMKV